MMAIISPENIFLLVILYIASTLIQVLSLMLQTQIEAHGDLKIEA